MVELILAALVKNRYIRDRKMAKPGHFNVFVDIHRNMGQVASNVSNVIPISLLSTNVICENNSIPNGLPFNLVQNWEGKDSLMSC